MLKFFFFLSITHFNRESLCLKILGSLVLIFNNSFLEIVAVPDLETTCRRPY